MFMLYSLYEARADNLFLCLHPTAQAVSFSVASSVKRAEVIL